MKHSTLRNAAAVTAMFGCTALQPAAAADADADLVKQGQQIFRFETFGDEQLWTDKLGLHKVVRDRGRSHHGAQGRLESRRRRAAAGNAGEGGPEGSRRPPSRCSS